MYRLLQRLASAGAPTPVEQSDRLDAAPDRLRRRQQLDPGPAFAIFGNAFDLVETDRWDHAPLVADIAHEARGVGKDEQALGLERGGDLHGEAVAVDIDGDTVMADPRRGHHRRGTGVEQEAPKVRVASPDSSARHTPQDLV